MRDERNMNVKLRTHKDLDAWKRSLDLAKMACLRVCGLAFRNPHFAMPISMHVQLNKEVRESA